MIDDEFYVAKLNEALRQNSTIIRKDYSLAKKYQKCLTEIENTRSIINIQKSETNKLISKLKTSSNFIDVLSHTINATDSKIDLVKGEIEILTEKICRIRNDIMTTSCSLSNDDELKILQRQMGLVLLNAIKYFKEVQNFQIGFNECSLTQGANFYDEQWSQFRMDLC